MLLLTMIVPLDPQASSSKNKCIVDCQKFEAVFLPFNMRNIEQLITQSISERFTSELGCTISMRASAGILFLGEICYVAA